MDILDIPNVKLPIPILLHAIGLVCIGLSLTFPFRSSIRSRASEVSSMLGITTTALGLAYLMTSYMPISENQFLHASVPVRLILAAIAGVKILLSRRVISGKGMGELMIVLLYDGGGAIWLGWVLGTWKGRVQGY